MPPFWGRLPPRGRLQMQRHLQNIGFCVKIDPPTYRKSIPTQIHLRLLDWMSPALMPSFWGRLPPRGRLQVQRHLQNIGFWVNILVRIDPPKYRKSIPTQIHLKLLDWMSPPSCHHFGDAYHRGGACRCNSFFKISDFGKKIWYASIQQNIVNPYQPKFS